MFFAGCSLILACGFATGHFHQVTAIRGRVVGKNLGPLQFRWLRRSFSIGGATLTLYEYHSPANKESLRRAAVTTTDSHGRFDFGSVPQGHYSLDVTVKDSDVMGALFDLEVTDKVKATETILLDASPIEPDCTGGHEFIEKKANATKN
jgi:hypothetical protein